LITPNVFGLRVSAAGPFQFGWLGKLQEFHGLDMVRMNRAEYSAAVRKLRLPYERLRISLSNATPRQYVK
jgi:hypothetical protein